MTTLQLQRLGDFGCAGQGVGHSVHHERAAVTSVTGNIHRRGIRGDAVDTRRKMRALGGHHRQRTTSSGNGHANGVEHTVLWARKAAGDEHQLRRYLVLGARDALGFPADQSKSTTRRPAAAPFLSSSTSSVSTPQARISPPIAAIASCWP